MTTSENHPENTTMTLAQADVGCRFQIKDVTGDACKRLREMGFCERMEVVKHSNGRNLICTVCGVKLALNKKLAAQVMVSQA